MPMTEQAKEARREYKRKWARENRDKVRQAQARYWERKAAQQADGNGMEKGNKEGKGQKEKHSNE